MTILFKEAAEWSFDKLDHRSSRSPVIFLKMARNQAIFKIFLVGSLTVPKKKPGILTS